MKVKELLKERTLEKCPKELCGAVSQHVEAQVDPKVIFFTDKDTQGQQIVLQNGFILYSLCIVTSSFFFLLSSFFFLLSSFFFLLQEL